jgi:hypothetical protein
MLDSPIQRETGRASCASTPYADWYSAGGYKKFALTDERMAAAVAELNFLEQLYLKRFGRRTSWWKQLWCPHSYSLRGGYNGDESWEECNLCGKQREV